MLELSCLCFNRPKKWAHSCRHHIRDATAEQQLQQSWQSTIPKYMWAHACHFTDDQVFEAALVTLITTSQRRIIHEAFISQWLPKFQSHGPIRACSEHFLVITQSVLLTNPAHQSVITSSPPNTQTLRSQPWTSVLARPSFDDALRGPIQWSDVPNTPSSLLMVRRLLTYLPSLSLTLQRIKCIIQTVKIQHCYG